MVEALTSHRRHEPHALLGLHPSAEDEKVYPFQLENRLYNERTPRDKGAEKGSLYSHTGPFSSPLSRERSLECKDDFPTEMGITPRGQNE